jgi:hypothetical protein
MRTVDHLRIWKYADFFLSQSDIRRLSKRSQTDERDFIFAAFMTFVTILLWLYEGSILAIIVCEYTFAARI